MNRLNRYEQARDRITDLIRKTEQEILVMRTKLAEKEETRRYLEEGLNELKKEEAPDEER